jgi:nucleotide-binding universal stress UspA family protein
MKNVLLLVHQDVGQEARLRAAIDVTRALSGHLSCLDVTPFPQIFDTGWAPPVILDEAEEERQNKALIQNRLVNEQVSWSWTDREGDYASCLLQAARSADIIVLNRKLDARPDMVSIASSVLTHCHALVLAVDERCRALDATGRALVAWDGSEKAFQALRQATPLLGLAQAVTIFQAGPLPSHALSASDAVQFLIGREIACDVEIGPHSDDPAADICAAARRLAVSYCVMGAYGHGRLRERLFGGVSRRMLNVATIPLLMAH